ncbi:MAG: hypothetical protein ACRD2B_08780 [Terriglobia bacterium]
MNRASKIALTSLLFLALFPLHGVAQSAPASEQILSPANIPTWLQTGKFRSSRWDGGPIEAEKGMLSGWPNYSEADPRQVLQATRDWYNPRTIEFLKIAHINWAWLTWSNGFSRQTEQKQWHLVSTYIKACHKDNIHVAAYFSIGNMFWKDMFEHEPQSISWVKRLPNGGPLFYSRPDRYMADITNRAWLAFQEKRVAAAARAGADAFWIDNTFSYYGMSNARNFIDAIYATASRINPHIVIMSNYNRRIYTWGRLENGVTTEDGQEPGYYTDHPKPYLVTNAGLLRYNYAIGEGWRPVSMEDGGRHVGDRLTTPMQPRKWQLAIAECAMYHISFEPMFEGIFLRNLYFGVPQAIEGLRAIGVYNGFLERNEQYYTHPESLAKVAVLSDTTDSVVPYLNQLSEQNLNHDVIFNYQDPQRRNLKQYEVIILPNTNPLSKNWCAGLAQWVREDGGTLIAVQDASLFSPGSASAQQDFGLAALLDVSKRDIPGSAKIHSHGKGRTVYLPTLPPAGKMAALVRSYLKASELVEVEPRTAILSNVAYQAKYGRVVLSLLNYRQDLEKEIRIEVRAPVERAEILSPDHLDKRQAQVERPGKNWEVMIPELRTYDLVAIYSSRF